MRCDRQESSIKLISHFADQYDCKRNHTVQHTVVLSRLNVQCFTSILTMCVFRTMSYMFSNLSHSLCDIWVESLYRKQIHPMDVWYNLTTYSRLWIHLLFDERVQLLLDGPLSLVEQDLCTGEAWNAPAQLATRVKIQSSGGRKRRAHPPSNQQMATPASSSVRRLRRAHMWTCTHV